MEDDVGFRRAPNCALYTDTVSTLVSLTATAGDCEVGDVAFSCQTKAFERPDKSTEDWMKESAVRRLSKRGCPTDDVAFDFQTNIVGSRETEYDVKKLALLGMASNCHAAGNDPNQATHQIVAKCKPMYDMKDAKGNAVRNYHMDFTSDLAACDVSDDAMPQLMEDARKLAKHNALAKGYTIARDEDLACSFRVLPHI